MKKEKLLEELERIPQLCSFVPNADPPYLTRLGEDNFRELKQNGSWFGKSAMLEITDAENFPADGDWQDELRDEYNTEVHGIRDAVLVPELHRTAAIGTTIYQIWERPEESELIINLDDFKKSFSLGDETYQKILAVAKIHWGTRDILDRLAKSDSEVAAKIEGSNRAEYFEGQFQKWSQEIQKADTGKEYLSEEMLSKIKGRIFSNRLAQGKMELSFNIFGNTDIRKTKTEQYYFINGKFDLKPAGFMAAAWLWNMAMWGWQKERGELVQNVFDALRIFRETAPYGIGHHLQGHILANLLERCYASINVDIRHRRAPYHNITDEEVGKGLMNFLQLTNSILDLDPSVY